VRLAGHSMCSYSYLKILLHGYFSCCSFHPFAFGLAASLLLMNLYNYLSPGLIDWTRSLFSFTCRLNNSIADPLLYSRAAERKDFLSYIGVKVRKSFFTNSWSKKQINSIFPLFLGYRSFSLNSFSKKKRNSIFPVFLGIKVYLDPYFPR